MCASFSSSPNTIAWLLVMSFCALGSASTPPRAAGSPGKAHEEARRVERRDAGIILIEVDEGVLGEEVKERGHHSVGRRRGVERRCVGVTTGPEPGSVRTDAARCSAANVWEPLVCVFQSPVGSLDLVLFHQTVAIVPAARDCFAHRGELPLAPFLVAPALVEPVKL